MRLGDVKTRNENWSKIPDQMLGYNAARTWGRRHLPEALLGMQFKEELEDMALKDITPPKEPQYTEKGPLQTDGRSRPRQADDRRQAAGRSREAADREAGRARTRGALQPRAARARRCRGSNHGLARLVPEVRQPGARLDHGRGDRVDRWLSVNFDTLDTLTAQEPKMWRGVENAINLRRLVLQDPQPQEPPQ